MGAVGAGMESAIGARSAPAAAVGAAEYTADGAWRALDVDVEIRRIR